MKVLMISTDRNLFDKESAVARRIVSYGGLVDELHVIVFSRAGKRAAHLVQSLGSEEHVLAPLQTAYGGAVRIGNNVWVHQTRSASRWLYIFGAYRIGAKILSTVTREAQREWILTCQDPFETGFAGLLLKRRFGLPLQIQIHTDFLSPYFTGQSKLNRVRRFLSRRVLLRADDIRVVSERVKQSLLNAQGYRLRTEPHVLPIADLRLPAGGAAREVSAELRARFRERSPIVLVVSRLEPEKNVALALKAIAATLAAHPNLCTIILGSGSERRGLEAYARHLKIVKQVVFEGDVADPARYYAIADIVLVTSNYEGYGRVLIEAAAAGKAIVTTDVGIVGDILKHDESALVCDVGDAACLTTALAIVADDAHVRTLLGTRAREKVFELPTGREAYLKSIKEGWERAGECKV